MADSNNQPEPEEQHFENEEQQENEDKEKTNIIPEVKSQMSNRMSIHVQDSLQLAENDIEQRAIQFQSNPTNKIAEKYLENCSLFGALPQNSIIRELNDVEQKYQFIYSGKLILEQVRALSPILATCKKIELLDSDIQADGFEQLVFSLLGQQSVELEIKKLNQIDQDLVQNDSLAVQSPDLQELSLVNCNLQDALQFKASQLKQEVPVEIDPKTKKPIIKDDKQNKDNSKNKNDTQKIEQLSQQKQESSEPINLVYKPVSSRGSLYYVMTNLKMQTFSKCGNLLQVMGNGLKVLRKIDLSGNRLNGLSGVQLLQGLTSSQVNYLNLTNNKLDDSFLAAAGALLNQTVIEQLILQQNDFHSAGAIAFASQLAQQRSYLKYLDLSNNNIQDCGCCALIALLSSCGFYCKEMQQQCQNEVAQLTCGKFFVKVPQNGTGDLPEIKINKCCAGLYFALQLNKLISNCQFEQLECQNNQFGDAGMSAIQQAIDQKGKDQVNIKFQE